MRKKSIFWGIIIILTAVGLILSNLGYSLIVFGGVTTIQLVFTILVAYLLYKGIKKNEIATIVFSIAFFVMIYKTNIGLAALDNWLISIVALLLTIGIHLIFGGKHLKKPHFEATFNGDKDNNGFHYNSDEPRDNFKNDNGYVNIESSFGSNAHYIDSFSGGKIETALGNLQVYFTNAFMMTDSANLSVENALGTVDIYVPKTWAVVISRESFAGSINVHGKPYSDIQHTLNIHAETAFGRINVEYIEV